MVALRQRRNILSLTLSEVSKLTAAFNTLKTSGTYDTFVRRHMNAMNIPMAQTSGNAAHSSPVFLPWHRAALWEIEDALCKVDPSITALPYWKWEDEASLNAGLEKNSKLWTAAYLGTDGDSTKGNRVLNGPFKNWKALIYTASTAAYAPRSTVGLIRVLGRAANGTKTLPDAAQLADLNTYTVYDVAPWAKAANTFRGRLEGWSGPVRLHNQVHRWIGGDMEAGTSPNDPVFWLHHANIDRIWWEWQNKTSPRRPYAPLDGGPAGLNAGDNMACLLGTWNPAAVQDITAPGLNYEYV